MKGKTYMRELNASTEANRHIEQIINDCLHKGYFKRSKALKELDEIHLYDSQMTWVVERLKDIIENDKYSEQECEAYKLLAKFINRGSADAFYFFVNHIKNNQEDIPPSVGFTIMKLIDDGVETEKLKNLIEELKERDTRISRMLKIHEVDHEFEPQNIPFKDEESLKQTGKILQGKLGLQSWNINYLFTNTLPDNVQGQCEYNLNHKVAEVRILNEEVFDKKFPNSSIDMVHVLVHELLHLTFADVEMSKTIENNKNFEVAIDSIAKYIAFMEVERE